MMGSLYGDAPWALLGMSLHMLFSVAMVVGLVFFFMYAVKFMKKDTMKKWCLWLVIVGLVGALLTCGLGWKGMQKFRNDFGPKWGVQVQTPVATPVATPATTPAPTK